MKKLTLTSLIALLALLAVACAGPPPPEPAAPVVEEPAVEEAAEEPAMEEEMEEEEMEEEMAEEPAMEEEMEEAAEEPAMEEEMVEEEAAEEAVASDVVYVVSGADSTVSWTGAKAVGNSHSGTVDISDGSLVVQDGALVSGSFVMDMTTISSSPGRLVDHLKADDFFGVATFPTASLSIVSVESLGGDQYAVTADLTIKEITNPIEFTATASVDGGTLTATADMVFDRSLFDVQYGSGAFFSGLGDDLINDEVEMSVEISASS